MGTHGGRQPVHATVARDANISGHWTIHEQRRHHPPSTTTIDIITASVLRWGSAGSCLMAACDGMHARSTQPSTADCGICGMNSFKAYIPHLLRAARSLQLPNWLAWGRSMMPTLSSDQHYRRRFWCISDFMSDIYILSVFFCNVFTLHWDLIQNVSAV